MKRFRMTVNGTVYEVEVEEVSTFEPKMIQPTEEARKDEPQAAQSVPEAAEKPQASMAELPSGTKISAPMPGKIVSVKAGPGQAVKRGDVLMVLEAMKMENEIQAPMAGTVTAIAVSEGANVNAGALLACIN